VPDHGDLVLLFAHDLRNPLAAIVANLCYLRSAIKSSEPDVRGALADAEMACAALDRMTRNLAVIGKASLNGPAQCRPTGLREVVSAAALRAQPAAKLSGVEMDLDCEDVPQALVDPDLIGLALDNLLSNSIQHSPPGRRVSLRLSSAAHRVTVTVLDDGPVVPQALREAALRADGQRSLKSHEGGRYGSGLSLFCAGEAVRLAGAALAVGESGGRCAFEISARVAHC